MSFHRPAEIVQVFDILSNGDARVLAGGTDIYPAVAGQELTGETVDITAIAGLNGISKTNFGWRFGATTTWSEIATAHLPPAFTALQQAAREIGSPQIQNAGTIGGNLCNASPAADGVPPLLVLDAEVEIGSATEIRQIPLADFILGVRQTALRQGEIVTAIHIPKASARGVSAFEKFGARKYLVISICMVAVRVEVSDGKITQAAVSVGAASPVALRLKELEKAMLGKFANNAEAWQDMLAPHVLKALDPIDDIRADAESRFSAAVELIGRAIKTALA